MSYDTKIVYEDNGERVVRGQVLEETEFIIKIRCEPRGNVLEIGKRAVIKIDRGGF